MKIHISSIGFFSRRILFNRATALMLFLQAFIMLAKSEEAVPYLMKRVCSVVPEGKTLRVNGAFKSSSVLNGGEKKIDQSCDDVVAYFSGDGKKMFWVTLRNMKSSRFDEPEKSSIFTTSIYSDGSYAQKQNISGKDPRDDAPRQVEISDSNEAYDTFSTYAVGLGYTLDCLMTKQNFLMGMYLAADPKKGINVESKGDETILQMNTNLKGQNEQAAEITWRIVAGGSQLLWLKSFVKDEVDHIGQQTLKKRDEIIITQWINEGDETHVFGPVGELVGGLVCL